MPKIHMQLRSNIRGKTKIGYLVSADRSGRFVYAKAGEVPIGVITESVLRGEMCEIQTTGQALVYVYRSIGADETVRSPDTDEGFPAGSAVPVGDKTSYTNVGQALETGKGLIWVSINLSATTSSGSSGLPAGGTTGQALIKASNTDYDVEWGSGGGSSIVGGYGITATGTDPVTIAFDGTELDIDDGTAFGATSYFVFTAGLVSERIRTTDVPVSTFDNDAGYTAAAGTVTSVQGSGAITSTGGTDPTIGFDGTLLPNDATALLATDQMLVINTATAVTGRKLVSTIALGEFNNDEGWASGTVTGVLGGLGIDSDGSSTTPSLSLDLSELIAATDLVTWSGTSYLPFHAGSDPGEKIRTTDIPISTWDNDSGFTANLGTVTNVSASAPLASSGGTTPNISFDSSSITTMAGALLAEDYILVTETSDSGLMKKKLISLVPLGEFDNNEGWASGTVTGVTGGYGITSDGSSTTPTIAFDGTELDIDDGTTFTASAYLLFAVGAVSERRLVSAIDLGLFNNSEGWTSSAGTVTSVSGGTGIDVTNPSTNPIVTLDVSELAERVGAVDATDRLVGATSAGVNFAETISNIALSKFNNDDGWTSDVSYWTQSGSDIYYSTGDVSIGITGGGYQTWPDRTLVVGATGSQDRPNIELHGNLTTSGGSVGALSAHNEQSGSATKCIAQVAFRVTSDLDAGRIVFQTASTAGTLTDRVTIDEVGALSAIGEITAFA